MQNGDAEEEKAFEVKSAKPRKLRAPIGNACLKGDRSVGYLRVCLRKAIENHAARNVDVSAQNARLSIQNVHISNPQSVRNLHISKVIITHPLISNGHRRPALKEKGIPPRLLPKIPRLVSTTQKYETHKMPRSRLNFTQLEIFLSFGGTQLKILNKGVNERCYWEKEWKGET